MFRSLKQLWSRITGNTTPMGLRKRPRDPIALGKMVVDIATGQLEDTDRDERKPKREPKTPAGETRRKTA
ncbi:MAG: hypothetical protein F4Y86_13210 [Gammaproteobacteria bacterium]|nr:hypothetical protein [Gammaproteobacteria bacterium]